MEKKKDSKKSSIILVLALLCLVTITCGVSYSFFNYVGLGTTENVIETGSITFIYEEVESNGAGISISNAFPMSDELGKKQTAAGEVFNFKILSNNKNATSIPYIIAARMKKDSTLDQSAVKLFLTEVDKTGEIELALNNYSKFGLASDIPEGIVERQLYADVVPANTKDYEKNYRLRMWIDDELDFSQNEDGTYPYNNKSFAVTVNVYANSKVVNGN